MLVVLENHPLSGRVPPRVELYTTRASQATVLMHLVLSVGDLCFVLFSLDVSENGAAHIPCFRVLRGGRPQGADTEGREAGGDVCEALYAPPRYRKIASFACSTAAAAACL